MVAIKTAFKPLIPIVAINIHNFNLCNFEVMQTNIYLQKQTIVSLHQKNHCLIKKTLIIDVEQLLIFF